MATFSMPSAFLNTVSSSSSVRGPPLHTLSRPGRVMAEMTDSGPASRSCKVGEKLALSI